MFRFIFFVSTYCDRKRFFVVFVSCANVVLVFARYRTKEKINLSAKSTIPLPR